MNRRQRLISFLSAAVLTVTIAGPAAPGAEAAPQDGHGRIAYDRTTRAGTDIFTIRPDGTGRRRLTFNGASYGPAWSPDGRRLLYTRHTAGGRRSIWVMRSGGGGKRRVLVDGEDPSWAPDGRRFAFTRGDHGSTDPGRFDSQIYVHDMVTHQTRQLTPATVANPPLVDGEGNQAPSPCGESRQVFAHGAAWSPDGRWIMFGGGPVPGSHHCYEYESGAVSLYKIRQDGSAMTEVLRRDYTRDLSFQDPSWAPGGGRILFARVPWSTPDRGGLSTLRSDGAEQMSFRSRGDRHAAWSPTGRRIVASRPGFTGDVANPRPGLWVLRPDGSPVRRVLAHQRIGRPDWQPVP